MLKKLSGVPFLLLSAWLCLTACDRSPGEGGSSSIEGKLTFNLMDAYGESKGTPPAMEERVYLIYGDDSLYSEDTRTNFDGTYEFKYLKKGTYRVFAYQDCITCSGGKEAVFVSTEITDNRSVIADANFTLNKVLKVTDGTSTISGKVYVRDMNNLGQVLAEYYGAEERVYIQYGKEAGPFNDVRTGSDGSFTFRNLIKGEYTIFAMSDCFTCSSGTEPVELMTSITSDGEMITLADLEIVR